MKTTAKFLKYATVGVLVLTIAATGCKRKKDEVEPDPDLTTERDLSNADNDMNSVLLDIDKAVDNSSASNLREEASYYATIIRKDTTVTKGNGTYTKMILISYTGDAAPDGQTRTGNIEIYFTGTRIGGDFKSYVAFTGTKVGGRSITGIKRIVQEASGNENQWKFAINAEGTITTVDGRTINYSSSRTRIHTGISTLLNLTDDSFTITGNWSGTNRDGETVSANISSALQLSYSCHYFREITAGRIDFTNSSKGITRSVDYGSGGCDGRGTFINTKGKEFTFTFKR